MRWKGLTSSGVSTASASTDSSFLSGPTASRCDDHRPFHKPRLRARDVPAIMGKEDWFIAYRDVLIQFVADWNHSEDPGSLIAEPPAHQGADSRVLPTISSLVHGLVVRRGFGWVEGGASSFDFGDDLLGGFVPDEGFGVLVPVVGPGVDSFDQLADALEAVPA